MPINVECSTCGTRLAAPDEASGGQVRCASCKSLVVVPMQAHPVLAVHKSELAETPKDCPFCGEHVKASAKKCKHCGETLDLALRAAEESRRFAEGSSRSQGPMVFMNAGGAAAASSSSSGRKDRERKPFSHGIHVILTLVTCGAWFPIWILLAILHKG